MRADRYLVAFAKWKKLMKQHEKDKEAFKKEEEEYQNKRAIITDSQTEIIEEDIKVPVEPEEPVRPEPPKRLAQSSFDKPHRGGILVRFMKPVDMRWKRLLEVGAPSIGNVRFWPEQHYKFEQELVHLDPQEDDDDKYLKEIEDSRKPWLVEEPKKTKKSKSKKKKSTKLTEATEAKEATEATEDSKKEEEL